VDFSSKITGGQHTRFRIEQGALTVADRGHEHQVAVRGKMDRALATPGNAAAWINEQPAVEVSHEEELLRHGGEAERSLFGGFRNVVEVPQVNDILGIEPWFDVGEVAILH